MFNSLLGDWLTRARASGHVDLWRKKRRKEEEEVKSAFVDHLRFLSQIEMVCQQYASESDRVRLRGTHSVRVCVLGVHCAW